MNPGINPWTLIAIFIIIAEIGRNIYVFVSKKVDEKDQASQVFKTIGKQKMNAYPFTYNGEIFIKAKNQFEAKKKFSKFKKEHQLLSDTLKTKLKKS